MGNRKTKWKAVAAKPIPAHRASIIVVCTISPFGLCSKQTQNMHPGVRYLTTLPQVSFTLMADFPELSTDDSCYNGTWPDPAEAPWDLSLGVFDEKIKPFWIAARDRAIRSVTSSIQLARSFPNGRVVYISLSYPEGPNIIFCQSYTSFRVNIPLAKEK